MADESTSGTSETPAERKQREARETRERQQRERSEAERAAAADPEAEPEEKRHPVEYLISHSRALLGVRGIFVAGAVALTDRKTLSVKEVQDLLKQAAEETTRPLDGTPQEPEPEKEEGVSG